VTVLVVVDPAPPIVVVTVVLEPPHPANRPTTRILASSTPSPVLPKDFGIKMLTLLFEFDAHQM
jgi:hypothetical protein